MAVAAGPWDTSLRLEAGSAIRRGCEVLAARQNEPGDWQRDVRRTALCIMALAGAPELRGSARRGRRWLAAQQGEAGNVGKDAISTAFTLLAFSGAPPAGGVRLRVTPACRYVLRCRGGSGGFALRPGGTPEVFTTACAVLALARFRSAWDPGPGEEVHPSGRGKAAGPFRRASAVSAPNGAAEGSITCLVGARRRGRAHFLNGLGLVRPIEVFQDASTFVEAAGRDAAVPEAGGKDREAAAVCFLLRYIMHPASDFPVDAWKTCWTRLRRDCLGGAGRTGPVRISSAFLFCALTGVAADIRGMPPEKRRTVCAALEAFVRELLKNQCGDGSWNTLDGTVWAVLALEACGIEAW